ncbi:polysaccharide biosynthesis protein [Saccharopolyspora shandongensis]|uniref:polysaccharide biosynthesis protein n=1 Tax=Saccharopolyspora shandongensis TaxID=418495 RepID=UPI003408D615
MAATWFRYEFEMTEPEWVGLALLAPLAFAGQLAIGTGLQMYRGRYWVGSVDEAAHMAWAVLLVGVVIIAADLAMPEPLVPRSVPMSATLMALFLSWIVRLAIRRYRERSTRPDGSSSQRVIVLGAGVSGQQLVRSMLSDPRSGYLPIALLDDDPAKRRLRIEGVPVRGTRKHIAAVAVGTGATQLVIAVRNADATALREVSRAATDSGLAVKILPPLSQIVSPWVDVSNLRNVDITDLLGRRQIDTDVPSIAGFLSGKRVLVTGAGGSIGSELCQQIHQFRPAELFMVDRDESALHAVQLSLSGRALLDSHDVILADIRDRDAIRRIFDKYRPDVVFHVAALKHLPMLERYPSEAWKTNVLGTAHVLNAARSAGVERFVNISTDKAANPTSILGCSKRVGERLTAHVATETEGTFLSVRFGNVLASRGSVITTFTEQIGNGGPITITHPDVTRFFMTIPEAVQLVIQAAAIGRPGEALVLDMGAPVRITDVARQLMSMAGRPTPIVYTGLRPGEKLHEELFGPGEFDERPLHPAISHVAVPPLEATQLEALALLKGEVAAMSQCAEADLSARTEQTSFSSTELVSRQKERLA